MPAYNYVLSKYMSGSKKTDVQLDVRQMVEKGKYEIEDPLALIAGDMFHVISEYIDPRYRVDKIRKLLDRKGTFSLDVFHVGPEDMVVKKVIVASSPDEGKYRYELYGGIRARQMYEVSSIVDADVAYLVSEHVILPEPGVMLAERCYHPYFTDLQSAIRYRDSKMRGYVREKGSEDSGWRLVVVDANKTQADPWYRANMKASEDIKRYGLNQDDYRYIGDTSLLREAIMADAYDDLDEDGQSDVNYGIYTSMRKYISEDYLMGLDDDVDDAGPGELEGIADTAIILAIIGAPDQEVFAEIKKDLGPNEYRVGSLTDSIYNAHRDEGCILVSEDGDMDWYGNVYYVNEWEGNSGNPWFGKFQPNENDTLLCFREYHPELIVKRLPRPAELRSLERKYIESISAERAKHAEMTFDVFQDDFGNDVDVCVGDWYYEGVASNKHYDAIHFLLEYNSYRFSEEQCRALLSGEELVIENFMSKIGRPITIRGKLKDCSTMYDQELNIQFTRTDISGRNRRMMDMSYGIEADEPGLPDEEDPNAV